AQLGDERAAHERERQSWQQRFAAFESERESQQQRLRELSLRVAELEQQQLSRVGEVELDRSSGRSWVVRGGGVGFSVRSQHEILPLDVGSDAYRWIMSLFDRGGAGSRRPSSIRVEGVTLVRVNKSIADGFETRRVVLQRRRQKQALFNPTSAQSDVTK